MPLLEYNTSPFKQCFSQSLKIYTSKSRPDSALRFNGLGYQGHGDKEGPAGFGAPFRCDNVCFCTGCPLISLTET